MNVRDNTVKDTEFHVNLKNITSMVEKALIKSLFSK
jgi:hypothetical protein